MSLYHQTLKEMARVTGLEPATFGVTGRHSNQLSYTRAFLFVAVASEGVFGTGHGRDRQAAMALDRDFFPSPSIIAP